MIKWIGEFGCSTGNITIQIRKQFPNAIIDAYEIKEERVIAARKLHPDDDINWYHQDILSTEFLRKINRKKIKPYDVIYFNPAFEYSFAFIWVALTLIKKKGWIITLLPDDLFINSKNRRRLARMLPFTPVLRDCVGKWDYYPTFAPDGSIDEEGQINKSPKKSLK